MPWPWLLAADPALAWGLPFPLACGVDARRRVPPLELLVEPREERLVALRAERFAALLWLLLALLWLLLALLWLLLALLRLLFALLWLLLALPWLLLALPWLLLALVLRLLGLRLLVPLCRELADDWFRPFVDPRLLFREADLDADVERLRLLARFDVPRSLAADISPSCFRLTCSSRCLGRVEQV
jgi:hypothetical protein